MKTYLNCIFILIVTVFYQCTSPLSSNQEKVQSAVDSVRKALSDTLDIPVPSLNVLIQTPTDKIFVSSAATPEEAITADTYFRFASNTKNFTSAAILNMYEDGWLDYKAKITDTIPGTNITYVPNTTEWNFPYKDKITIELLLQHSAGVFDVDNDSVPGYGGATYTEYVLKNDPAHQFSPDEMVKVLTQKRLSYFPPDSGYHYSNTGFSILSKIIATVYSAKSGSAKSYGDYLSDSLVGDKAPVPLAHIHFPVLASETSMPDPHVVSTILTATGKERYDKFNMSAQVGEGNGYGTMNDLNTYIRTMMKGENVLTPATVQLMQNDTSAHNPGYALGCFHQPVIGYGHNGARIGYLSMMVYDPENDISIVVMLPLWDLRKGNESFIHCFTALKDAVLAARGALGYRVR